MKGIMPSFSARNSRLSVSSVLLPLRPRPAESIPLATLALSLAVACGGQSAAQEPSAPLSQMPFKISGAEDARLKLGDLSKGRLRPGSEIVLDMQRFDINAVPVRDAPIPSSFGLLALPEQELAAECREAIARYRKIASGIESGVLGNAVDLFAERCTPKLISLPQDINTDWTGEAEIDRSIVARGVGALLLDDVPWCTGLVVGKRAVLTARHCLFHPKLGGAFASAVSKCSGTTCHAHFARLGDAVPLRVVAFTVVPKNEEAPRDGSEDYALLHLATDVLDAPHVVAIDAPALPAPAFIVGVRGATASVNTQGRIDWRSEFRAATPFVPCTVTASKDEQILHTCQTWLGFSGSPLISQARENSMDVIGLHIGSENEFKPATRKVSVNSKFQQNAAVRLREAMLLTKDGP